MLATRDKLCKKLKAHMQSKFQISSIGEMNFFLGLQVNLAKDGIFINQEKYIKNILNKFSFEDVQSMRTHIDKNGKLVDQT